MDTKDIKGGHYSGLSITPFQYSYANKLDCFQHTIIKYVTRHKEKGGTGSLLKALNTLHEYIETVVKSEENYSKMPDYYNTPRRIHQRSNN